MAYSDYGGGAGKVGGNDYFSYKPTPEQTPETTESRKRGLELDDNDIGDHSYGGGKHASYSDDSDGDIDGGRGHDSKRAKTDSSSEKEDSFIRALVKLLESSRSKESDDSDSDYSDSGDGGGGDGDIGGNDHGYGGQQPSYAQQQTPPATPTDDTKPVSKAKVDNQQPPAPITPPATPPATPPSTPVGDKPPVEQKAVEKTTDPAKPAAASKGSFDSGDGSTQGTSKASSSNAPSDAGKNIAVGPGGENKIHLTNSSSQPQSYALFVNPGPGMTASFDRPDGFMTLKPGESADFNLPGGVGGYVQQMNNYTKEDYDNHVKPQADNFKATRAEYKFDNDGQLWFNASNIDGYNAAMKMKSGGSEALVGGKGSVLDQIAKEHPELVKEVGGQKVLEGPQFFTNDINQASKDAFNKVLGNSNTYVLPDDNQAMRHANSNSLDLEFGNA